jgi:DNA primase
MSRIENTELQEALETIDLESWLDAEGVRYRPTRGKSGPQFNVKECPVCGNSKYKVFLNQESGLGNCFHGDCEAKFNKWRFIHATLGGTARATIEHIKHFARTQGWRPKRVKAAATSTGALTLPESIPLPYNGRNLKYLENRGITADIAQYFELRFSHHGKFPYLDGSGEPVEQDYANRIIIPVFDLEGQLVSFQGRDITGTADRKYLFPPGFASTGSVLFNGHNAHGAEHIVLNEGVFDVAAAKIALDGDMTLRDIVPVGTFGKHLSHGTADSQLARLLQLKEEGLGMITIMWDGEARAILDAVETGMLLRSAGFMVRIAILPDGKDPNEVAPDVVRRAFYHSTPLTPASAVRLKLEYGRR